MGDGDSRSTADARLVKCPSCGAERGKDCFEIDGGTIRYNAHAARQKLVDRLTVEANS